MKKNYTHIVLLIDRSGSMSTIKSDMEGGMETFLNEQKKIGGDCTITAAQFDTEYEILFSRKPIKDIEKIQIDPRGGTALIDSMSRLIKEVGKDLDSLEESEKPDRVLFVTITDGEENSSREYTNEQLKEMINHQSDSYNWAFSYIGANQDSFGVAGNMGISSGSTINYNASTYGINNMFTTLSNATTRYRSVSTGNVTSDSFSYTEDEQKNN